MDALKIGDAVRTGDRTFSMVYSFGHKASSFKTNYLQVFAANMEAGHPLEISMEHLIYTHDATKNVVVLVAASDLQVGGTLLTMDGILSEILWIRTVQRQGVYSPLTESGNLLVNGVLASSYVSRDWLKEYVSGDTLHAFQHSATLPVRLFCAIVDCKTEGYNETTGFSMWVQFWFGVEQWQLLLPTVWQMAFLSFLVGPVTVIMLFGKLLIISQTDVALVTHVIAVIIGFFVWKQQKQKKRECGGSQCGY